MLTLVLTIAVAVGWILFDVLISLRTGHMTEQFPDWEWWAWLLGGILLAVVAGGAAVYSHLDDVAQRQEDSRQMKTVQGKVDDIGRKTRETNELVVKFATDQARSMRPSFKTDALSLGAILVRRATDIQALEAEHRTEMAKALATSTNQGIEQANEPLVRAIALTKGLTDDYQQQYAKQVLDLRNDFIQQGQKDWNNPQYYETANSVDQIQAIGSELLRHATDLPN